MRRRTIPLSAAVLLCGMLLPAAFAEAGTAAAQSDVGKLKSMAESQHEIVMLLLKKKEYEQAAREADKIFEMKWPAEQEPLLLKELLNLADQFLHHKQARLGIGLLDRNAGRFKSRESRIAILKEKGYLHKNLDEDDKALECFREAQKLEKPR